MVERWKWEKGEWGRSVDAVKTALACLFIEQRKW